MSLYHANAGQAEIIRTIQKDQTYVEEIRSQLSDILLLISQKNWFKYQHLCKLIAEILYHHYAIVHNLQTLGEEYTGIIQVDTNYVMLPNKALQIFAILLEYGGEHVVDRILTRLQVEIDRSDELLPEARDGFNKLIDGLKFIVPYVRGFHTSLFYIYGGKYHISKRLVGINYILIRNWLKENHSIYGFRILGVVTLVQLVLSIIVKWVEQRRKLKNARATAGSAASVKRVSSTTTTTEPDAVRSSERKCALCMEPAMDVSTTQCGHLFCWVCILNWLDEREICPICREAIKKSRVVKLQNFC
ncbi:peroxisome biogenesis factor 10 [Malaya genurostris]|uniref:peroxisome biogenesis factor 10 n=1 Tax=Malaya genurostris TaxID=325434 RepID=UPI0026F3FED1|nr:peroxisome biogenesis factor 10 [Malaya genurostris]XP_058445179.1 peroxisome biogenesis factor 10 [Malaya genurostris]